MNKKKITLILCFLIFIWTTPAAFAVDLTGKVMPQGLRKSDNILVYLTKTPGFENPEKKEFIVDQNNLTFLPHVLVIPVGSSVTFPNNDKVDHNVFSLSRTRKFNFGSYKPGQSHSVIFEKPGIVELRCDLHSEMISYILVMKSPYYALTDKKGAFKIDVSKLAHGKYFLKTWHEKLKNSRITIDLAKDIKKPLNIKLKRGTSGVLYK